ncbi:MAG: adenosylcobinamide amidohydrolase, partial [Deltaproteobacteria bacterium]|nr:adenosylcobinamide amidohydrolase [Deltaproteobacteria bacterium]
LPNMRLTPRAMTRAIISATEAKTAALTDLDIRSSYTSMINQATGTGTDNMIVVEGKGTLIDNSGGHTKVGELIAGSVYGAVTEAIYRQNGIITKRNIFQRLEDRKISLFGLINSEKLNKDIKTGDLVAALEEILLQSFYASFISSSLSLSDDYEKGLITDLGPYRLWCNEISEKIAGKKVDKMIDLVAQENISEVVKTSLNALLNGLYIKMK